VSLSKIEGLPAFAATFAGPLSADGGSGFKHFGHGFLSSPADRTHLKPHVGHSIRLPTLACDPTPPPGDLATGDLAVECLGLTDAGGAPPAAPPPSAGAVAAGGDAGDAAFAFGLGAALDTDPPLALVGDAFAVGLPLYPFGNGFKHFGHGFVSSPGGRVHLKPHVGHSIRAPLATFEPIESAGLPEGLALI